LSKTKKIKKRIKFVVQEFTQVLSPIEEEDQEDHVDRERVKLEDARFPTGSDDEFSGSQQSIELKVGLCTSFYVIHYNFKILLIVNNIQSCKSGNKPQEAILTSQQETPKGRGERKRQSSENALEG